MRQVAELLESAMQRKSNPSSNLAQSIRVCDLRVWREIQYLDSSTYYRECCVLPEPKSVASEKLQFLDDQARFPWGLFMQWFMGAVTCVILIVLICTAF